MMRSIRRAVLLAAALCGPAAASEPVSAEPVSPEPASSESVGAQSDDPAEWRRIERHRRNAAITTGVGVPVAVVGGGLTALSVRFFRRKSDDLSYTTSDESLGDELVDGAGLGVGLLGVVVSAPLYYAGVGLMAGGSYKGAQAVRDAGGAVSQTANGLAWGLMVVSVFPAGMALNERRTGGLDAELYGNLWMGALAASAGASAVQGALNLNAWPGADSAARRGLSVAPYVSATSAGLRGSW